MRNIKTPTATDLTASIGGKVKRQRVSKAVREAVANGTTAPVETSDDVMNQAKPAKAARKAKAATPAPKPDTGKGSAVRKAAAAKAAATRRANLEAQGRTFAPKPQATGHRHAAAVKAHLTRTQAKLKGTRGKLRDALKARVAHYEQQLAA